jgi:hypothetical protein
MKKYFLGLSALLLAVAFSSFTLLAPANFRYLPASENETAFEDAVSWTPSGATHSSCTEGEVVCIIEIDDAELAPFSGTNVQKLAAYMAAQGSPGQDFDNALEAAEALQIASKD